MQTQGQWSWQEMAGLAAVIGCVLAGLQWLFQRGASIGRLHARLETIERSGLALHRKIDVIIERCPKMHDRDNEECE